MKKLLLLLVTLFVIALLLDVSAARKNRKRNNRRKSSSTPAPASTPDPTTETLKKSGRERSRDADVSSNGKERGSRRKEGKRGRKKLPVLKTSIRAKKITERRYLKSDWCKSQPVRQQISTTTNCHGVVINQFCYGQCNSFYIPKDIAIDSNEDIEPEYFKSCSFCKPKTLEWISVRLRCKNIETTKMPRFITKKVKRVKGCTCVAVPDLENAIMNDDPTIDLDPGTPVLATLDPNR